MVYYSRILSVLALAAVALAFEDLPVVIPENGGPTIPNADSVLNHLLEEFEANGRRLEELVVPEGMLWTGNMAIVDVLGTPGTTGQDLRNALEAMTLEVTGCFELAVDGACSVMVPLPSLRGLAESSVVSTVASNIVGLNFQGAINSFAPQSMDSDDVRRIYNVSGRGIKIGVISDSFNITGGYAADILSQDLPPGVQVLDEGPVGSSDEGRAMMQLIHDVAPDAELAFHTGFLGQANFAQGIFDLANAGCDIIVDDVRYFTEPFFQDGLIARAVDYIASFGFPYFASQGNYADNARTEVYNETTIANVINAHLFDSGSERYTIDVLSSATVYLQWEEPAFVPAISDGVRILFPLSPRPTTDFDLYVFNTFTGALVGASVANNAASGFPYEAVFIRDPGRYQIIIVKASPASTFAGRIKLFFRGGTVVPVGSPPNELNDSTSFGHSNAGGAMSVGAAFFQNTPGFGTAPALLNGFSSKGGQPISLDYDGTRLASDEIRFKPDFVGPDGTCTTFFGLSIGTCSNAFFGTSAAAPNVAAVAALLMEIDPFLGANDVRRILRNTAADMDSPYTTGPDPGYDTGTGFGFVQALAAAQAASSVAATTTTTPATTTAATTTSMTTTTAPQATLPGGMGDPHFKRFQHSHRDSFHGECDIVLVKSSTSDIEVHLRTTIRTWYSFIEKVAIRLGKTVLEFEGKQYWVNGVLHDDEKYLFGDGLGKLVHMPYSRHHRLYEIGWLNGLVIFVKASKNFMSVTFDGNMDQQLMDSVGMLGSYSTGDMLARNGTVMQDFNTFGFEWQYHPDRDGPMLFMESRSPQLPEEVCRMPTSKRENTRMARKGGDKHPYLRQKKNEQSAEGSKVKTNSEKMKMEDHFLYQRAQAKCASWHPDDVDLCIKDVMLTHDLEMADAW